MKRIIGFLTAFCLTASLCPAAFAVREDTIKKMDMNVFADYAEKTEAYRISDSKTNAVTAKAYGTGVSFHDNSLSAMWFVKEADGNIALSFPNTEDKIHRVQTTNGATGTVTASLRVKPLGSYGRLTLQVLASDGNPLASLRFDPTADNGTKLYYTDGDVGTNEFPANISMDSMLLPINEWSTVSFTLDTRTRSYSAKVSNSTNSEKELVSGKKFRYTDKGNNVGRIAFAVNRGVSPWYSNGCYFDDFYIGIDDKITGISGDRDGEYYLVKDSVSVGKSYKLSEKKVTALLASGNTYQASVAWDGETDKADTSTVGSTQEYCGTVTDSDGTQFRVKLSLAILPLTVEEVEENITVFLGRDSGDAMPSTVKAKYEDGSYGFAEVVWDNEPDLLKDSQVITGTAAGFSVTANVKAYDTNKPVLDMNLSEYQEGDILRNSPWTLKTTPEIVASEFPKNSGNMAMKYSKTVDKKTGDISYNYACISAKEACEGMTLVSTDLYLPEDVSSFKLEVLDINYSGNIVVLSFKKDGTIVNEGNSTQTVSHAFPTEKWFNVKLYCREDEQSFDVMIDNASVAENWAYKGKGSLGIVRFSNQDKTNQNFVAYADNIKMYALSGFLDTAYEEMRFHDEPVTKNLVLPTPSDSDVTAEWSSSDETLIAKDGTVTLPAWGEGEKSVTLRVKLSKNIGAYTVSKTKDIVLTVAEAKASDTEAVAAALAALSFESVKGENSAEDNISSDLSLPSSGEYDTAISWTCSPAGYIDSAGRVYLPENADQEVILTATVTRGTASQTKSFALTLKYSETISDLQAVRRAMAALNIPAKTSSNLDLPTSGEGGVDIAWTSDNLSALSDSGVYQKPEENETVVLTAILTKGAVRETKSFTVSVSAYKRTGGGGGGSSGGGGSVRLPAEAEPVATPEAVPNSYTDIAAYGWAKTAIENLTAKGILSGTGNGAFEPARNVKREEFVAMAVRAFLLTADDAELPFTDVKKTDWHYETTRKAWSNGLISGVDEENFGSGMDIKRQDMFVILYQLTQHLGISLERIRDSKSFADDSQISDYAREAVYALYEAGLINGYDDEIHPLKQASRAEAAKMIYEIGRLQ